MLLGIRRSHLNLLHRRKNAIAPSYAPVAASATIEEQAHHETKLNPNYRFDTFIEGPANQFVKSAAMGIAMRPGQSYNPLFIHGGVGLGKTHILHSIGHYIREHHKSSGFNALPPKLSLMTLWIIFAINRLIA